MKLYILAFLVAVLPVIIILGYIYIRNRHRGIPVSQILVAMGLGVVASLVALFFIAPTEALQKFININNCSVTEVAGAIFFTTALPGELLKFAFLCLLLQKNKYFLERKDGITYSIAIAMGYVLFLNVFYIFADIHDLKSVAIMRSLLAVPVNLLLGISMGYYYSLARLNKGSKRYLYISVSLLLPILIHVLVSAFAMMAKPGTIMLGYVSVLLLIISAFINLHTHRRLKDLTAENKD